MSQLRKTLGPVIVTRAPGYVLELDPEHVDVHLFDRLAAEGRESLRTAAPEAAESALRRALALWRGPALADFRYEPFAQTEIARLEELRTVVLEERIEADLALGRHAELVSELEALVQSQPLRERPRAQLMLALYRSGRQADALAAYRAAREVLVEELGIDPGPELRELEAAILRQDESLLLPARAAARPSPQLRRLAATLCVDIVESIALGELLDPEALAIVQSRYLDTVSTAITRHGGTVEKFGGGEVVATFGVPVAHEDDALRAARAAFDLRKGVAVLSESLVREHDVTVGVRIGIAAGEVVATHAGAGRRFVVGDSVGIAAQLCRVAAPGDVVVGDVLARLIDHAALLESRGVLEVPGRSAPIAMFLLREIRGGAPAFEERLEAPFVGRKRELAALRRVLRRSRDTSAVRVALVVGPAGVGKSRLAVELTRRVKDVTTLLGRCLSYGEGITYWPLRELLAGAAESDEQAAVVAALDAETPPPAAEVALLFRRLCETLAQERPLVLVFEDVHWAEPTLLELVEHLADRGEGPITILCLAREELLEEQPGFLADRPHVDRVLLDGLSVDDTVSLLEGLGGAVLEPDRRSRIVETAEGNPLFLEQLLALALEGGFVEESLPVTIRALLAARLDRLGPGERALLERGAVVGREFSAGDVLALLDPDGALTADAHLQALAGRGFIRPRDEGLFGFRHAFVHEAVYRASPKRLRAELHERRADWLDVAVQGLSDLDELVGYHLEQAVRLRVELGESDRHTQRLGDEAGRRLGEAGLRSFKRGDLPAAESLFRRSTSLLPSGSLREALRCELGIVLNGAGRSDEAVALLEHVIEDCAAAGDRVGELRSRLELEYVRVPRAPHTGGAELLDVASRAIPALEAAGDDRWLGRALVLTGWVHGGRLGHHGLRLELAERALVHYARAGWPAATPAGEIANALYYGPTPVPVAIERCRALRQEHTESRHAQANVDAFLGGLLAQRGEFELGRDTIASARSIYDELGLRTSIASCGAALGDVYLLEGAEEAAEEVLRGLCAEHGQTKAFSHLASRAGDLAEALYRQGRIDESADWVALAETHCATDDLDARLLWMPVRAKITARRGDPDLAVKLVGEAVELAASTDGLNRRAAIELDHAEVLRLAGETSAATLALERARELFEAKGNVVAAARAAALLGDSARA